MRTPDDRVWSYLADELDAAQRQEFEAELARDPELRAELEEWRMLAQAQQLDSNEQHRAARDAAFLRALESAVGSKDGAARLPQQAIQGPRAGSAWQRFGSWLLPRPVSPLLPAGWALVLVLAVVQLYPVQPGAGLAPPGVGLVRGGAQDCFRLALDLPDALTVRELRGTLAQYDAFLAAGPDAQGHFVLGAARASSLHDAAAALGAVSIGEPATGSCAASAR